MLTPLLCLSAGLQPVAPADGTPHLPQVRAASTTNPQYGAPLSRAWVCAQSCVVMYHTVLCKTLSCTRCTSRNGLFSDTKALFVKDEKSCSVKDAPLLLTLGQKGASLARDVRYAHCVREPIWTRGRGARDVLRDAHLNALRNRTF